MVTRLEGRWCQAEAARWMKGGSTGVHVLPWPPVSCGGHPLGFAGHSCCAFLHPRSFLLLKDFKFYSSCCFLWVVVVACPCHTHNFFICWEAQGVLRPSSASGTGWFLGKSPKSKQVTMDREKIPVKEFIAPVLKSSASFALIYHSACKSVFAFLIL